MTVVNPKSISGINSITTGSGSDNLLTIHTSDASSTERVRINSSGDVIVGSGITVSPDGDIFTTGVTTATTFVGALTGNVTGNISGGTVAGSTGTFTGDVDIADKIVHTGDTNTALRFPAADTFTVETGGSERIRIDSSGRLLLGTTTEGHDDADEITISGTRTGITIRSANDDYGNIFFSDATSGTDEYVGAVQYYHSDNSLRLKTSSTDRVKIQSGGYLNVLTGGITCTDDGAGSGTSNLELQPYGTDGYINCTASGNLYTRMGSGYAIRTKIDSSGNFHINSGNVVITTAGKGIDFSAQTASSTSGVTVDSEVFDHYEEGSWTPSSSDLTVTNNNPAKYTRIGDLCHVFFDITFSGAADSSQASLLTNFPFTAKGVQQFGNEYLFIQQYSGGGSDGTSNDGDNKTLPFFGNGNSTLTFWNNASGHTRTRAWAVGRRIRGSLTYLVN